MNLDEDEESVLPDDSMSIASAQPLQAKPVNVLIQLIQIHYWMMINWFGMERIYITQIVR